MKCKNKFDIKTFDMFGKRIELYYKKRQKKHSLIGIIFTIIYVVIFCIFFIYKLVRMINKFEATFYDTYAYIGKPPSFVLNKEMFYGGFALEDPNTYDSFIDEQIYYPKAYFKKGERNGDNWQWTIKELELENCKLEKFGSSFQDIFKEKPIHNFYCFKEMNETLIGHFSYDDYSLFYIAFFPCKNSTENNNHCKTKEEMDYYLKSTFVTFQIQDVEMTPQNYSSPVLPRGKDIYTIVGKKLYKEIHALFQIVNVETDQDYFGLDDFQNVNKKQFLKYDSVSIMSNIIEDDIYETGQSFCNVTLKLSDKVLTQKRTYTKLIDILGNIGGFMQVIYSLLRIISSFSTHILYEKSLVNNLFEFNIDNKVILINNNKKNIRRMVPLNLKIYVPKKSLMKVSSYHKTNEEDNINQSRNNLNKSKIHFLNNQMNNQNGDYNLKTCFSSCKDLNSNNKKEKKNLIGQKKMNNNLNNSRISNDKSDIKIFNFNMNNMNNMNYDTENVKNRLNNSIDLTKGRLIKKIKININLGVYFCFCFIRKRKNIQNILLDEGIKIIIEKLDILNIFKKLYKEEKNHEIIKNDNYIKMSHDCKFHLQQMYNSIYEMY